MERTGKQPGPDWLLSNVWASKPSQRPDGVDAPLDGDSLAVSRTAIAGTNVGEAAA
jgi:hypothetical protein